MKLAIRTIYSAIANRAIGARKLLVLSVQILASLAMRSYVKLAISINLSAEDALQTPVLNAAHIPALDVGIFCAKAVLVSVELARRTCAGLSTE